MLAGLGIDTGIDLAKVVATGQWVSGILGRKAFARAGNAIAAKLAAGAPAGGGPPRAVDPVQCAGDRTKLI